MQFVSVTSELYYPVFKVLAHIWENSFCWRKCGSSGDFIMFFSYYTMEWYFGLQKVTIMHWVTIDSMPRKISKVCKCLRMIDSWASAIRRTVLRCTLQRNILTRNSDCGAQETLTEVPTKISFNTALLAKTGKWDKNKEHRTVAQCDSQRVEFMALAISTFPT